MSDFTATVYSSFNATAFARLLENDPAAPAVAVQADHSMLAGGAFSSGALPAPAGDTCIVLSTADGVLEPMARLKAGYPLVTATLDAEVDAVCATIARLAEHARMVLVATWIAPYERSGGVLALDPAWGADAALAHANRRLVDGLGGLRCCYPVNADAWVRRVGPNAFSAKNWFLTKDPYSFETWRAAVADVKTALGAIVGRAKKLLILDLDNTLWGGEVGDSGVDGLRLGGHDAVGEAYVAFQRAVLALSRRGVVLALASKNDERLALAAIDAHPEMVLRRDDVAGWRINWDEKAPNIVALCRELELSPADAVFIDDNPGERERVAAALPELTVPDWPGNPMLFVEALGRLNLFDVPAITAEDVGRGRSYAAVRAGGGESAAGSVTIDIAPIGSVDAVRALQLLNKTNQMNLATRRVSEGEFDAELASGTRSAWTVRVADRFADYGLTGLFVLEFGERACSMIDFVMSCRVMARGVEERMLAAAMAEAGRRGYDALFLQLTPTERNEPMQRFLRERSDLDTQDGLAFRAAATVGSAAG